MNFLPRLWTSAGIDRRLAIDEEWDIEDFGTDAKSNLPENK
jgi:hypothetical protein